MTKKQQQPNSARGSTAFHWALRLFFAAIVVTNLHAEEELLFSNNFDSDMDGVTLQNWADAAKISIALDATQSSSGKQSLKISKNDSVWGGVFIKTLFKNNATYRFSCRVKIPDDSPNQPQMSLTVMYVVSPGGKRQISKPFPPLSVRAAGDWTEVECIFTINEPEGDVLESGVSGIIFPTGTTPDCTLYVDDVELRRIAQD